MAPALVGTMAILLACWAVTSLVLCVAFVRVVTRPVPSITGLPEVEPLQRMGRTELKPRYEAGQHRAEPLRAEGALASIGNAV